MRHAFFLLNTMDKRTEKLRQLMADHHLKASDVAEIVGRKANTVRIWRMEDAPRVIPANVLRLLELELERRQ